MKSYFVLHLKNRFQALTALTGTEEYTQTDTDEVNTKWEQVKKACSESSEACLGFKQRIERSGLQPTCGKP